MSKLKESIRICDVCDTKVGDEGKSYYGGHPHHGWFELHQVNGSSSLKELRKQRNWDFCSLKCLTKFIDNFTKLD